MLSTNELVDQIKRTLKPYKDRIETFMDLELDKFTNTQGALLDACKYSLRGPAKRFRPIITLILANQVNPKVDLRYAALAIELFHTSSLIADDLPSMDNDSMRRGKQSTHVVFGNDVALLASYALIGAGYECLFKQKSEMNALLPDFELRTLMGVEMLAKANSLDGVPLGQWLDLHSKPTTVQDFEQLFYKKTVMFFEVAFAFGWLFAGGDHEFLSDVKKAAYHFGTAFQIYDDISDYDQDKEKERAINLAVEFGESFAVNELRKHSEESKQLLRRYNLYSPEMQLLHQLLEASI